MPNNPKSLKDTSKSNTNKWRDEDPKITFERLVSKRIYSPDSEIHIFHRAPFTQPWSRDLGNLGSPSNNLLFTPDNRVGPSLGYHIFDAIRLNVDSMKFYNTVRPYSLFSYQLGSKLEQTVRIMHTQNVKPNWNFCFDYRKTNSPGFYKIQRTNHDNLNVSSNYKSLDKHYSLYAGLVYNKQQNDESGGLAIASELDDAHYGDRKTLDAVFQSNYSATRSSVTNVQRDFTLLLQHSYVWGNTDTVYSSDSTSFTYSLKPKFSITHKMELSTEKHTYKDLTPDSIRYVSLFHRYFVNNGSGYYSQGSDSVYTVQKWFWIDNKVVLNGFIGKGEKQLTFSAGLGNRYDRFISDPSLNQVKDSLPALVYKVGYDESSYISNYITGEIKKEALKPGQWEYKANTQFFVTGQEAGKFSFNALIGRELKKHPGSFVAGFSQQLNSTPYSYSNYQNAYTKLTYNLNTENINTLFGKVELSNLKLSGGITNYLINNYIYISEKGTPAQYDIPFNLIQVWGRKVFKLGNFYLDNELVFQQAPDNAPVNVPTLMGRHQFSIERPMFKRRLKIAAGIEVRYNTQYYPAGYNPLLNKFFYQHSSSIGNVPEAAVFANFKIKRFRAFVIFDNIQQLFAGNAIIYTSNPVINFNNTGYNYTPVYAASDAVIRFGFSWPLVN